MPLISPLMPVHGYWTTYVGMINSFRPICMSVTSGTLQRVDFCSHLAISYQRMEDEPFLIPVHLPGILFQNICGHLI